MSVYTGTKANLSNVCENIFDTSVFRLDFMFWKGCLGWQYMQFKWYFFTFARSDTWILDEPHTRICSQIAGCRYYSHKVTSSSMSKAAITILWNRGLSAKKILFSNKRCGDQKSEHTASTSYYHVIRKDKHFLNCTYVHTIICCKSTFHFPWQLAQFSIIFQNTSVRIEMSVIFCFICEDFESFCITDFVSMK